MRPDRCWMQVTMLAAMVLCLNADGEESECEPVIKVKHGTTYDVAPGEELRIECRVILCEDEPSQVSWYKHEGGFVPIGNISQSRFKTEWNHPEKTEGISYLIFKKTVRNDSGDYQCRSRGQTSHMIKVNVSDEFRKNSTKNKDPEPTEWLYVGSAAGIVTFVVVVIVISVVAMRGCKGKSKGQEQADSQYIAIPMTEHPLPRPPPRGSPIVPPCRTSIQRKTQEQERERGRRRSVRDNQETDKSIVYAALNHPLPPRGGARPRPPAEAPSEYAAIRVA